MIQIENLTRILLHQKNKRNPTFLNLILNSNCKGFKFHQMLFSWWYSKNWKISIFVLESKNVMKKITTCVCKMGHKSKTANSESILRKKFRKKNTRQNFYVLDFFQDFTYLRPKKYFKFCNDKFSVKTWGRKARITTTCCARSPGYTTEKRSSAGAPLSSL